MPPAPFHRGMGSRAGGIRTHVGSVGNHTHPASRIAVGATRHPFCARERGRACLWEPIFCSFTPTFASCEAEGRPKRVSLRVQAEGEGHLPRRRIRRDLLRRGHPTAVLVR